MTYGIIYLVENKINGKRYVGQTVQPLRVRWLRHCRPKGNGCVALASAIAKYGTDAFSVSEVAHASSKEELNQMEADLVVALGTLAPAGYNLRHGGGSKGKHSASSKAKMSAAHNAPERVAKLVQAMKQRWQDASFRQHLSVSIRAWWAQPENKQMVREKLMLSASRPESKAKKSAALKSHYSNPENLAKLRAITSSSGFKGQVAQASTLNWQKPEYRAKQSAYKTAYWNEERRAAYGRRSSQFLANPHLPPRADNTTGYRGVKLLPSGKFEARATVNKKSISLGVFSSAEQAHAEYVKFKSQMVLNLTAGGN